MCTRAVTGAESGFEVDDGGARIGALCMCEEDTSATARRCVEVRVGIDEVFGGVRERACRSGGVCVGVRGRHTRYEAAHGADVSVDRKFHGEMHAQGGARTGKHTLGGWRTCRGR